MDAGLKVKKLRRTRAFPGQPAILLLTVALVGRRWDFQSGAQFWTAILILTVALVATAAGKRRRTALSAARPKLPQAQPMKSFETDEGVIARLATR